MTHDSRFGSDYCLAPNHAFPSSFLLSHDFVVHVDLVDLYMYLDTCFRLRAKARPFLVLRYTQLHCILCIP